MDTQMGLTYIQQQLKAKNFLNDSASLSSEMEPPRKKRTRARLDHLTAKEKQERRKEKNRQAAQTARDRKRKTLERVMAENEFLRCKVLKLEQTVANLMQISHQQYESNNVIQTVVSGSNALTVPQINIANDSGISDIDSTSKSSSPSPNGNQSKYLTVSQTTGTTTPDSMFNNNHTAVSPVPSNEDLLIDSFISQENEGQLEDEVFKVMDYIGDGVTCGDVSIGSAESINTPPQKVKETHNKPSHSPIVNSLGWTSIQLMLILLISRIHHRLSGKINCCQRDLWVIDQSCGNDCKSSHNDQHQRPNHGSISIVDYILDIKCTPYRNTVEAIISNKANVMRQRNISLEFINKYLSVKMR